MLYYALTCLLGLLITRGEGYKIEGKVVLPPDGNKQWVNDIQVLVDGGKYRGYLRTDGTFTVHNVPTGSYVVEVFTPKYLFEPLRVDVSMKGNLRARKVNHLKPSQVTLVKYPLEMKPATFAQYFQVREKFSILDLLKSPMVLMMVLPLVMLVILPKMMNTNDPELKKEMEQSMNMFNTNQSGFDLSESLSNFFGGSDKKALKAKDKSAEAKKKRK
ncbi:endoplasmic reticulum membrane protein complex subunit 7-like [Styela clava]|uniref:ER membrane protein complex subunit 7-like n=1 Tax=Styela clava TaxID=7725 RepID=UPI00193A4D88|nr:ER membrane protein complex subunit 7-like [Styela clava]